jgi:hypothetical protein
MDSKTVKLFVDLGLPKEIVLEIDNKLIDIYRKEHHKKFRFYGFNVQNVIFPQNFYYRPWGDIFNRYRELNSHHIDMFGFPHCIKIFCNNKLRNLIMEKISYFADYDYEAEDRNLKHFVKDHRQARIESGHDDFYYSDNDEPFNDNDYFYIVNGGDNDNDSYDNDSYDNDDLVSSSSDSQDIHESTEDYD